MYLQRYVEDPRRCRGAIEVHSRILITVEKLRSEALRVIKIDTGFSHRPGTEFHRTIDGRGGLRNADGEILLIVVGVPDGDAELSAFDTESLPENGSPTHDENPQP